MIHCGHQALTVQWSEPIGYEHWNTESVKQVQSFYVSLSMMEVDLQHFISKSDG